MENLIGDQRRAPNSDVMDVVHSVQASNKALPEWISAGLDRRVDALKDLARLIEDNGPKLANALERDIGLPRDLALETEIPRALMSLREFIKVTLRAHEEGLERGETRLPSGIAAIITSWSEPLRGWIHRLTPALLVGNAVISKLSSHLRQTNTVLIDILQASKIPPGIVNMIYGQGSLLTQALVQHPGIGLIAFSGRTDTGSVVAALAVENMKKYQLSLGARNAAVIFADTPLDEQMPHILNTAFEFRTSAATRASRFFVQEGIYQDFLDRLKSIPENPAFSGETLLKNKKHLQRATEQALSETGKLLTGGTNMDRVTPTVIYDLSLCSTLQQDDIDAPFITVSSFKYAHDAVKQANTSPYGQAAYVWTADESRRQKTAAKIESGRIFFNKEATLSSKTSYAGLKTSAVGSEGGLSSLNFFSKRTRLM